MSKVLDPKLDGVTHINAYSKGKTELGQLLSNFSHSPFIHPEDGPFDSIEGYWYWLQTKDNLLRFESGAMAKKRGKEALAKHGQNPPEDFTKRIGQAIFYKIVENEHIKNLLMESKLPIEHYYVRNNEEGEYAVPLEKYRWICETIEIIRADLKGEPIPRYSHDSNKKSNDANSQMSFL